MCDAPHTHAAARILFVSGVITVAAAQMNANAALFVRAPTRPKERNTLCALAKVSPRCNEPPPPDAAAEWVRRVMHMRAWGLMDSKISALTIPSAWAPAHTGFAMSFCCLACAEAVAKTGYFCHHFESFAEMSVRRSLNCGEAFLNWKSQETILWLLHGNLKIYENQGLEKPEVLSFNQADRIHKKPAFCRILTMYKITL